MVTSLRPISFQESRTDLEGPGAGFAGLFSWARLKTATERTDKRRRERICRITELPARQFAVRQRYHRKTVISDKRTDPISRRIKSAHLVKGNFPRLAA